MSLELKESEYREIRDLLHGITGIDLGSGKKMLVRGRLWKELGRLGLERFSDYVRLVKEDSSGLLLRNMVDLLTTNYTFFFREEDHFEYLRREYFPSLDSGRFRAWSAGCSSGEEPYSLAMLLRESLRDPDQTDAKILATDISSKALKVARKGSYPEERMTSVPEKLREKYFSRSEQDGRVLYTAKPPLTSLIAFRQLNLMDPWPMKGPFDVIMCRNVLIYFNAATRGDLLVRFLDILRSGGLLIVGHSEGFTEHRSYVRQVAPSIYQKY